ncbi:hypothetical protein EDD15DRAFT_2244109 [Pisolithus albus]|nr:hypothetical protein EDD15DRAFT_2244109 [Pisolithus albus]
MSCSLRLIFPSISVQVWGRDTPSILTRALFKRNKSPSHRYQCDGRNSADLVGFANSIWQRYEPTAIPILAD